MEFLFLLAIAFVLAPYGIGIWAHVRATRLELQAKARDSEIARLRAEIDLLRGGAPADDAISRAIDEAVAETSAAAPSEKIETAPATPAATARAARDDQAAEPESGWRRWARGGLERQFGAVLPVWIGGIAIAFAGFFLVKYSIDNNLIGPETRVTLGGLLGGALLAAARWITRRRIGNGGERIAQALAGAGIAVLYVSVYAATALYGLLPSFIGFLGMAAITGLAVILALRHGPPIALLGMIGGFLTPALFSSGDASAFLFFSYLYFVLAALMLVIRSQGWWLLSWPAVIVAFGWALAWIVSGATGDGETVWLGLFLAAVAGTVVTASRKRYDEEVRAIASWRDLVSPRNRAIALNVVTVAGAMALMAVLAFHATFGPSEWLLFAVLAVGAVALAFFDPRLYGFAPWAAMAVNAVMLAGWSPGDAALLPLMLAGFGALYTVSGFLLISSAATPLLWAALSAASALGYFLIAFFRLTPARPEAPQPHPIDVPPSREPVEPLVEGVREAAAWVPHVWAVLAMGLAIFFLAAALWAARRFPASIAKERVLAVYALATTAFLALTFFIELDRAFLSVAIAAELLAVAWVASKTRIASLRPIAALLGIAFAFLLVPQILLLLQLSIYSIIGVEWRVQESIPIVDFPTFQLALPAALFLLAGYGLRREADGLLIRLLEFAALALIALWGFYTTAKLFHPGENVLFAQASFLERAVITNVLFAFGIVCLVAARMASRIAFFQAGVLLVAVALFRILYFDLLTKNPLWFGGAVAGTTPFDALTVAFAVPMLWCWLAGLEIGAQAAANWLQRFAGVTRGLIVLFAFAWISLEIRKLFHGEMLDAPGASDAEFYSYSAAWLAYGLALLVYGTLKGSQFLRYASLAMLLLTVSKVFLLDADNLTGLYRVVSFLGLGLSLLGISYFYGRFVFAERDGGGSPDGPAPAK